MLIRAIDNISYYNLDKGERIDIQKGVIVNALLDSEATGLVISLEFARK